MFVAFKLNMYYFSWAVILVQFFMKYGELDILCRIFIAYSIANHLIVNLIILIEPRHEKTNILHMRKQKGRSASR